MGLVSLATPAANNNPVNLSIGAFELNVGDRLVIVASHRSGFDGVTISPGTWTLDAANHDYTADSSHRRGTSIHSVVVDAALISDLSATSNIVTVEHTGDVSTGCVGFCAEVTEGAGFVAERVAAGDNGDAGASSSVDTGTTAAASAGDVLVVVAVSARGGTSLTATNYTDTESSFNEGSTSANSVCGTLYAAYLTGQPSQTYSDTITFGTDREASAAIVAYVAASGPSEQTATVTPADLVLEAEDPAGVGTQVTATVAPAELVLEAEPVGAVSQLTATVAPAELVLEAQDPTATPGVASATVAPAVLSLDAQPVVAAPGEATATAAPAELVVEAEPVGAVSWATATVAPAELVLEAAEVSATPAAAAATVALAELTLEAGPVGAVSEGAALTATVAPAVLVLEAELVGAAGGSTTVAAVPAVLVLEAQLVVDGSVVGFDLESGGAARQWLSVGGTGWWRPGGGD